MKAFNCQPLNFLWSFRARIVIDSSALRRTRRNASLISCHACKQDVSWRAEASCRRGTTSHTCISLFFHPDGYMEYRCAELSYIQPAFFFRFIAGRKEVIYSPAHEKAAAFKFFPFHFLACIQHRLFG
jgi:hypothetical protein